MILVIVIALPTIASAAQALVPALTSLVVALAIARLAFPAQRRRW